MNLQKLFQLEINDKNEFLKLLFFLAFFGGLIRLLFAVFLPLDGYDETYHLLISQKPLFESLKATLSVYPPLWTLVLYILEKISFNYHFLRLASVGIGIVSIIVMGLLGKILVNPKAGILLALIFALSPTQIYYSSYLRLYSVSILISLLIFWLFIKYLKTKSLRNKTLLFSFLTLGNYTYYLFPAIGVSFATYLLFFRKTFIGKFKEFSLLFALSLLASLPLYIAFLSVEPAPKEALPNISLLKIISIPISYTFPLNLTQLTDLFPKLELNLTNLLLLILSLFATMLVILSIKVKNNKKNIFLILTMLEPVLIVIIFSILVKSVFGLRSLLIFSIPFYLLLGRFLIISKKISFTYIILSLITIFSTLIFIIKKPIPGLDLFIEHNVKPEEMIIHTEVTTYTYFTYFLPQVKQLAAIDSLYTNNINKKLLGYQPIEARSLDDKNFWVLEVPSEIHKNLVDQFKSTISKTHNLVLVRNFDEVIFSRYESKTR